MKYEISSNHTKACFADALREMLCRRKLSQISVSDLVRACGVNRKTFYYHFESIHALLKWMLEEEAVAVVKQYEDPLDNTQVLHFAMDYVEKNEHLIQCALDEVGRDGIQRFFYIEFESMIEANIDRLCTQYETVLEPSYRDFLTYFYSDALAGALVYWLRNREQPEHDEIITHAHRTICDSLDGIIRAYAHDVPAGGAGE